MKSAKLTPLLLLLIASFSCLCIDAFAQNNQTKQANLFKTIDRLNGNEIIARLAAQRNAFNKNRTSNKLPKAEYIINRNNLTLLSFDGLDYVIKNNRITAIQGLELYNNVLQQITDKLLLLDSIQYQYSEQSNMEYFSANIDFQKIRNIDRQFILSLKILSSTVRDISALAKNENPSLTLETNVSKMRLPNIDKAFEKPLTQVLVQLAK